jgi:hypothetical protein
MRASSCSRTVGCCCHAVCATVNIKPSPHMQTNKSKSQLQATQQSTAAAQMHQEKTCRTLYYILHHPLFTAATHTLHPYPQPSHTASPS